jgi:hypothetical protein
MLKSKEMNRSKIAIVLVLAVCLFASGYLVARGGQKVQDPRDVAHLLSVSPQVEARTIYLAAAKSKLTDEEEKKYAAELTAYHKASIELYTTAASEPTVAREVAVEVMRSYLLDSIHAKSAMQDTRLSGAAALRLQSLQVAQNARIIELLQKIADKK